MNRFPIPVFRLLALLILVLSTMANAQTQPVEDNFEGNGTITTWFGDDCEINPNFNNPFQQGINTSAKVLRYNDIGGQYANTRFEVPYNFNLSVNRTFSLKIYVPSNGLTGNQANRISLKLQDGTLGEPWTTQSEISKPLVLNQWQTVTFDFQNDAFVNLDPNSPDPTSRTDFNRVVIQVNGENNTDRVVAFIDDFAYDGSIGNPVFDQLVWSDEFETDGAVNSLKWFHQTQLPAGGSWFNNERQHYTNRLANSFVSNGTLKIVAKKETFTSQGHTKNYTSARLNSKFAFKYGKVEFRAKLLTGNGTWPALWTLGKNVNEAGAYWQTQGFGTVGWPACGEMDIMEHWGNNQNYVQSATHTPSSHGATVNVGGQMVPTAATAFHIYTLEWFPNKLVFSVDGNVHFTYNPLVKDATTWPFTAEQYLLMNIAIEQGISPAFVEGTMEVDYVRVYQAGTTTANSNPIKSTTPTLFPNPADEVASIDLGISIKQNVQIQIHTMGGGLVKTFNQEINGNRIQLDQLDQLASGLYMVSFQVNQKQHHLKLSKL